MSDSKKIAGVSAPVFCDVNSKNQVLLLGGPSCDLRPETQTGEPKFETVPSYGRNSHRRIARGNLVFHDNRLAAPEFGDAWQLDLGADSAATSSLMNSSEEGLYLTKHRAREIEDKRVAIEGFKQRHPVRPILPIGEGEGISWKRDAATVIQPTLSEPIVNEVVVATPSVAVSLVKTLREPVFTKEKAACKKVDSEVRLVKSAPTTPSVVVKSVPLTSSLKEDTRRKPAPTKKVPPPAPAQRKRPNKGGRASKLPTDVASIVTAQIGELDAQLAGAKDAALELREEREEIREQNRDEIVAAVVAEMGPRQADREPADPMELADGYTPIPVPIEPTMVDNIFKWRDERIYSRRLFTWLCIQMCWILLTWLIQNFGEVLCHSGRTGRAFCALGPAFTKFHEARTGTYDHTKTAWLSLHPDGTRKLVPTNWLLPQLGSMLDASFSLFSGDAVDWAYVFDSFLFALIWFKAILMSVFPNFYEWLLTLLLSPLVPALVALHTAVHPRLHPRVLYCFSFVGWLMGGNTLRRVSRTLPSSFGSIRAVFLPLQALLLNLIIQTINACYHWLFPTKYTELEMLSIHWLPFVELFFNISKETITRFATVLSGSIGWISFIWSAILVVMLIWGCLVQLRRLVGGHQHEMRITLANCHKWEKSVDARTASASATKLLRAAFMTEFTMSRGYSWIDTILLFSPWKVNKGLLEQGLLTEALSSKFDIPTLSLEDQKIRLLDLGKMGGLYNLPRALCFDDFVQRTAFVAWEVIHARRIQRAQMAASSSSVFQ